MSHTNAYPVNRCDVNGKVLERFPSIRKASRTVKVEDASIKFALERGTCSAGFWWRYADMPASAQPLRPASNWKKPPRRGLQDCWGICATTG